MAIVAAVQLNSTISVGHNLKQVEAFFVEAKEAQADLLVLPENFALMGTHEVAKVAEAFRNGEIQEKLSQLAKYYRIWVIAGTLPLRGEGAKIRASSLVFDDDGRCVARYDKIHLFDVRVSDQEAYNESLTIEGGKEVVVVDTPVGRTGLTVCYDLRFPELYQRLTAKGAEVFSVPSAFTAVTGQVHWEVLLRARAIENLCYVVAANQDGFHENGRQTYGHTMIIEPWGRVIALREAGVGIITAVIDLHRLQQLRRQFPCNEHHVLVKADTLSAINTKVKL